MIYCPLCGNPICSNMGFSCKKECLNDEKNNNLVCLQRRPYQSCRCSHKDLRHYFINKYLFDSKMTAKQMIKKLSLRGYLPDELFEI